MHHNTISDGRFFICTQTAFNTTVFLRRTETCSELQTAAIKYDEWHIPPPKASRLSKVLASGSSCSCFRENLLKIVGFTWGKVMLCLRRPKVVPQTQFSVYMLCFSGP